MENSQTLHASIYMPNRAIIRASLESTRVAFHYLLNSINDADLEQPCGPSEWTVKELLCHMIFSVEIVIPMLVRRARRFQNMPKLFERPLGHWLNHIMPVLMARGASRESLAQRYDTAHENLLELLAAVRDDEWNLSVSFSNRSPLTLETVFYQPREYFTEHAPLIRQAVGNALKQFTISD